jgi:hypothetical protein
MIALSPEWRWWALALGLYALERSIWYSMEASNRNQLIHQVAITRWLKVESEK